MVAGRNNGSGRGDSQFVFVMAGWNSGSDGGNSHDRAGDGTVMVVAGRNVDSYSARR